MIECIYLICYCASCHSQTLALHFYYPEYDILQKYIYVTVVPVPCIKNPCNLF